MTPVRHRMYRVLPPLVLFVLLVSCQGQEVTRSVPEIVASYPHDALAFTQGLLLEDGYFYESTGLYGSSSLREVVPESGEVLRVLSVPSTYFAEGLALVGDRLIQLTWREGEALVYDRETFEQLDTLPYQGEGWGLCFDGESLYMSDGSATLTRRDPESFEVLDEVEVTLRDQAVRNLNELECVGSYVYANVWQEDTIVKIDKASGRVVEEIDASGLLSPEARAQLVTDAVLNGIAYNPERETFYLTGKLWPQVFEVRFVGE